MRKIKIIIFLILILILVVGCVNLQSLPFFGGKQDKPVIGRGIKMYFMPGAPPIDRILISENSKFLVRVGIENYGQAVSGKLIIWDNIPDGIEEKQGEISADLDIADSFEKSDPSNPEQITRVVPSKNYFPKDGPIVVDYKPESIALGTKLNIFAEWSTDDYPVTIQTGFCLKRETAENVPCSNQEIITSSKLGAVASYIPVTIERIEKIATPYSDDSFFVDLKIVLKNLGGGEIVDSNGRKDILKNFDVKVVGGQGGRLTCSYTSGLNQIVFNNNEAIVNCAIEGLRAGQSYTDHKLEITYSFPYKMRIKAGPIPLSIIEDRANLK